jgi:hypothetical protein
MNAALRRGPGLLATMLLLGCAAQRQGEDVCQMTAPPVAAAARSTHAGKLLTYPASIDKGYTGCQVTWLENGHRLTAIRFEAGAVASVELREPDGPTRSCVFTKDGALTQGEPAACLPRDRWLK